MKEKKEFKKFSSEHFEIWVQEPPMAERERTTLCLPIKQYDYLKLCGYKSYNHVNWRQDSNLYLLN